MNKSVRNFRLCLEKYRSAWRKVAVLPIRAYQRTLSFDHGPLKVLAPYGACPFFPTCSEYAVRSILKYGVFVGSVKGFWRVCRCHPWTNGGVDHP